MELLRSLALLLATTAVISAALVGPSPQTLLVPHGVNATVQFTCSDGPVSGGAVGRFWLWTMLGETYTSTLSPRPTVVSVMDSASDSNDEPDAQSTLTISSIDDIVQSPTDSINVTCTRRLTFISGPNQDNSSTATLVTFGPLQQPTVSHNTTSVLVQWMPPLLQYADDFQYNVTLLRASSVQTVMSITSNDTMALLERPAVDGNNCTQYIVHVTAIANGGHGPTASSGNFYFSTGKYYMLSLN